MSELGSSLVKRKEKLLHKYFSGNAMDYKQVVAILVPIFVDQAFIVIMAIINTAMISSSGVAAISAVSMVDSLNMFIISLFIAVATGGTVIVAQYKGSGNQQKVSEAAAQSMLAVSIISLVVSILVIVFHQTLLHFLFGKAEAEVFRNAEIYLVGLAISFPFFAVYQAIVGALRGVAETRASLMLSVILNVTAVILNVILIVGFKMGVMGLVISIVASRVIGVTVSLLYLIKFNQTLRFRIKHAWRLNMELLKKIMYIGVPFAAEQLFFNGGKLLTQTFIVQLGTFAITANAIGNSISLLYQIGGMALSIGIVTVVGQCIGSRNVADAKKFIYSFLGLGGVLFVIATAIILPLYPILVRFYSPPEHIIPEIFQLVLLITIAQPFLWCISFVLPSALRSAGDSKYTSIVSLMTMWVLRIGLGYLLGISMGYGLMGIWIAMVTEWAARGIMFLWRLRGDKWYKHKLI